MLLFHPPTIVEIGMVGLSFILPTCLQKMQNRWYIIILYTLIVGVREYGEAANNLEFNNLYQTPVSASRGVRRTIYCTRALCASIIEL